MLNRGFADALQSSIAGLILIGIIVFCSILLSSNEAVSALTHFSSTVFAILLGMLFSPIYFRYQKIFQCGISFSSKKLLRLGIVFYGFNITFNELASIGFWGFAIASLVIISVFLMAWFVGVKIFGLDKEISMLIGAGSGICGAAAILALESSLRSDSSKGIIAVGVVVVFGLLGMFLYPLMYVWGMIPYLNGNGMGIYMGATLYEVANVAGAAEILKDMSLGEFSQSSANLAILIKMMRVVMLVPFLLFLTYFISLKDTTQNKGERKKDHWNPLVCAFMFLGVIVLNTFLVKIADVLISHNLSIQVITNGGRFFSTFCIAFAMAALGLQIDFKKFIQSSPKAFALAFLLCIVLVFGGYFLTLAFKGVLW